MGSVKPEKFVIRRTIRFNFIFFFFAPLTADEGLEKNIYVRYEQILEKVDAISGSFVLFIVGCYLKPVKLKVTIKTHPTLVSTKLK